MNRPVVTLSRLLQFVLFLPIYTLGTYMVAFVLGDLLVNLVEAILRLDLLDFSLPLLDRGWTDGDIYYLLYTLPDLLVICGLIMCFQGMPWRSANFVGVMLTVGWWLGILLRSGPSSVLGIVIDVFGGLLALTTGLVVRRYVFPIKDEELRKEGVWISYGCAIILVPFAILGWLTFQVSIHGL